MGFSSAGVCIVAKASPVENFEDEWKNDMVANIAILFC
jgi:hypothetical protein